MSNKLSTKTNSSANSARIAKQFRPTEDRVSAFSRFDAEYQACGGNLENVSTQAITRAMHATGIDSMTMLAKGYSGDRRVFVLALAEQFIDEYECTKPSEKATAQLAAQALTEVFRLSEEEALVEVKEMKRVESLSRRRDTAHRQYIQAIKLLRMLKQPKLTVNVQTQQAYFAHNQQINHG
jgi:hypothetical protein